MSTRRLAVAMTLLLSSTVLALPSPTAQAAPPTTTFTYTGVEQQYTVPPDVVRVAVHLVGGRGGCPAGGDAIPYGTDVTLSFTVTPGQVLYVEVGGNGGDTGIAGFNGGGAGTSGGGGGGGASDLRTVSRGDAGSLDSRLVVAGGGGGGGGGNDNCLNGSADAVLGGPGVWVTVGPGGASGLDCVDGAAGELARGGAGGGGGDCNLFLTGGGGGGGGYVGGGGGGGGNVGAAGGQGSSLNMVDEANFAADTTGVPMVEITPLAGLAPTALNYPIETVGQTSATKTVVVSNPGTADLNILNIAFFGSHASDFALTATTCDTPVAQAGSCTIGVAFKPKAAGARSAVLAVITNGGALSVPLTGTSVSNQFTFVKVVRYRETGRAKVVVAIPGPGHLKLTGLGVKTQRKTVAGPKAGLLVVPEGTLRERLRSAGEVRVKVKVRFTPTGGDPRTKEKWVNLVLS